MSASNPKNIVFDVVGTLVSFDNLYKAIEERLGEKLIPRGIQSKLLGCCWQEMAEREYTYLSLAGRYVAFREVFESLFYRTLHYAGVENPRSFASPEDVACVIEGWKKLGLRDGASECISKLRDAGFTVWCFTAGDIARVGGYFTQGGVDLPPENLLSCDTSGIAKPSPEAYDPIFKKLSVDGSKPWFAAAHLWDSSAAQSVGFKTAYCTALEGEELPGIFGKMDVIEETLPAMADRIIAVVG
ncbi:hypothetical protein NW762_014456 [Fusarium torreyae]|uniref:2-haloalkanoic acid dehalogenase n=1 Tax=Fusarium torreyae TaxID=1237075 RepID=A0A9W8V6T3_9HYPO|nr:hypothetical protein NW762_014456 [Fusarium torreyae]